MSNVDVLTCAAPNWKTAEKYCRVSYSENVQTLKNRMAFVLKAAHTQHADVLILGAYGCGVFGQDPKLVADLWKTLSESYTFQEIYHPVPKGFHSDNNRAFHQTLDK